jgi:hypothetical protein
VIGRCCMWGRYFWRLAMGVLGIAYSKRRLLLPRHPLDVRRILHNQLAFNTLLSCDIPFWSNSSGAIYGSDPQRPLLKCVFFSQHIRNTSDTPKSVICKSARPPSTRRIAYLDMTPSIQQQVLWLDITMGNTHRVKILNTQQHLLERTFNLSTRHSTFLDGSI